MLYTTLQRRDGALQMALKTARRCDVAAWCVQQPLCVVVAWWGGMQPLAWRDRRIKDNPAETSKKGFPMVNQSDAAARTPKPKTLPPKPNPNPKPSPPGGFL